MPFDNMTSERTTRTSSQLSTFRPLEQSRHPQPRHPPPTHPSHAPLHPPHICGYASVLPVGFPAFYDTRGMRAHPMTGHASNVTLEQIVSSCGGAELENCRRYGRALRGSSRGGSGGSGRGAAGRGRVGAEWGSGERG